MKTKETPYKVQTARKRHTCQWCRASIERGSAYIREHGDIGGSGAAYHQKCYDKACGKSHKSHVDGEGFLFPVEVEA